MRTAVDRRVIRRFRHYSVRGDVRCGGLCGGIRQRRDRQLTRCLPHRERRARVSSRERVDGGERAREFSAEGLDLRSSVRLGRLRILPRALLRDAPRSQIVQLLLQLTPRLGELHHLSYELGHLALLLRAEVVERRVRVFAEGHVRSVGGGEGVDVRAERRRRRRARFGSRGRLGVGRDALPRAEVGVVDGSGARGCGSPSFSLSPLAARGTGDCRRARTSAERGRRRRAASSRRARRTPARPRACAGVRPGVPSSRYPTEVWGGLGRYTARSGIPRFGRDEKKSETHATSIRNGYFLGLRVFFGAFYFHQPSGPGVGRAR